MGEGENDPPRDLRVNNLTTQDLESPLVSSNHDQVLFEIISHYIGKSQSPKQKCQCQESIREDSLVTSLVA